MATSVWKGFLTIPIRLLSAARSERISLNQLHKVCNTRIKMPQFCPTCDRKVERNEIVKGYEFDKDQYVLFDEAELDEIEPDTSRTMEILEFVKLNEIDPVYLDASYYIAPEDEGRRAYQLLQKALEQSGYSAIAKLTMHQREHTVIIRHHKNARGSGMILHTMYYQDEIRDVAEYGDTNNVEVKDAEQKLALQLIENLAAPFQPEKYHDEYQEGMRALIAAKQQGKTISPVSHPSRAPVVDLMQALQQSLQKKSMAAPKRPPVRAVPVESKQVRKTIKKA
jgi:DNA end-binding protein Ku